MSQSATTPPATTSPATTPAAPTPAARPHGLFYKAFNLSVLEKNRWPWVDYLRGIALILVVYRHVLIGIQRSVSSAIEHGAHIPPVPDYLETANMIFFSFRMPLFFILSGCFVGGSLAKRSLKQLIGIKFENLMYPYLIWVFFQITLQIILGSYTNSDRTLIDYTYILYNPRQLDQFWYLPALFNTSVVYLLVKTYLRPPMWGQFAIGACFYFLSPWFHPVSMISDWMEFYIFFTIGDSIGKVFFLDSTQRLLSKTWLLLAIAPVFFLTQVYYLAHPRSEPGKADFLAIAVIGCLSMVILAFCMQRWDKARWLRVVGYHSLYIYVTHVFVAGLVRMSLTHMGIHNPFVLLGMGIFFSVTIPIIFYNLLVVDGPLWWTFSFRKSKPQPQPAQTKPIPATS